MVKHLKTNACTGINLAATGHGAHWTYDGQEGPKSWVSLSDNDAACKTGKGQSPVNLTDTRPASLAGIQLAYAKIPLKILNNGHTVQADYGMSRRAGLATGAARLAQLHSTHRARPRRLRSTRFGNCSDTTSAPPADSGHSAAPQGGGNSHGSTVAALVHAVSQNEELRLLAPPMQQRRTRIDYC